ncbi:hypothetical protein GCK32_001289 [Trichostrongylus colubriformis]|uniref:Uncharacterized protein n=1 Tax=Trichostrongylus colubriformis TaxID=6319 RepID=A0AAN8ETE2_TRICO
MPSQVMKLLIGANICAVVTMIFICISLFTQEWVTVSVSVLGIGVSDSAGIFPWGCISSNTCDAFWNNADGWDIMFFIVMLLAWIFQFCALIPAVMALFIPRFRRRCTHNFSAAQILVTLLLVVVLITYGIEYDRNTANLLPSGTAGLNVSLGSSYWLLLVATIFSLVTASISGSASKKMLHHDCEYY